MAAQAPKLNSRTNSSAKNAYVNAAHKLLEFAVKEAYYYPEPEEVLDDERTDSKDKEEDFMDVEEDFMDHMFNSVNSTDKVTSKDPSLRNLKEINVMLPAIVEKTRRSSPATRRSIWSHKLNLNAFYYGKIDRNNLVNQTEEYKHKLVTKLCLAWFLNARRFIYRALDMRKPIMEDKRYKLGFLFHALRMNVFDQHKLFQGIQQQEGGLDLRNFENTYRVHKKLIHMNVDLNDLISYIRLLHYNQPDPVGQGDYVRKKRKKRKKGLRNGNNTE